MILIGNKVFYRYDPLIKITDFLACKFPLIFKKVPLKTFRFLEEKFNSHPAVSFLRSNDGNKKATQRVASLSMLNPMH